MGHLRRPPTWALAADFVAVVFLVAGTVALLESDLSFRILGVRISLRTAWRPYLWGVVILVVRNCLVRRPTSFASIFIMLRATLTRLASDAKEPLPLNERALFGESVSWARRAGALALLLLGFSALVIALTWPQIRRLDSVADLGDPLFYTWRIAWVAHQLPRDPLALFHTNQVHPERYTLTYSDSSIAPAVMMAPLFWMGLHPVVIYNIFLLSSFVLSGVAMFVLVRALTGRIDASMVAGTIFALYPYRFEHYPHLDLQMTMWTPLTLWAIHRTMARGLLRDGLATGLAFALQMLSSLYYGLFLAVYLVPIGGALWLARGRPSRPLWMLAAGAALAAVMVSPVVHAYTANQAIVGHRDVRTVQFYSAEGRDYLEPHFRSLVYGRWSDSGESERQLFPRIMPVALAAVALWPPLSAARIAYALALVVAVDGSLGLNGGTFPLLYSYVAPFRGVRVPARFSIFVGLALSVLAAYGVARMMRCWPRYRKPLTAALLGLIVLEAIPRMPLERVWRNPPPIYASISDEPSAVLAEFPMPTAREAYPFNARYLYFSTFHWHPLVNGDSGYFPPSFEQLVEQVRDFPSEIALNYLRSRDVTHLTVHGAFMDPRQYQRTVAWLDTKPDLEIVAASPWEGAESRLYRLK